MSSKIWAVLTSTIAATPRLFLRTPPQPAHNRYAGLAEPRSPGGGLSSPAGLHRRPWLARLRRALEEQLFVLHYQPIVSLNDGSVSHYEALVRLADEPGGGLVAPGRFLPAAERYGLIRDIDRMVLGQVAALLPIADRRSSTASRTCASRSTARRCRSPMGGCWLRSNERSRVRGSIPRSW